ncbi:MAG: hypothetical protein WC285_02835 [Candidatus Gracilibacteria bacterium]|jgi:hypothetical protein
MLKKLKEKYHSHKLHRAQKHEAGQQLISQIKNAPSAFDEAQITWEAPEYVVHQRGLAWKITMLVFVALIAGLSLYYDAWSFALVIVVFAAVYAMVHLEHPRNVQVKLSEIGIKIGFRKYSYSKIKSFWIIYEPPFVQTLNIRVEGDFIGEITIQLAGQDPSEIREYLISKIPELEGKTESFSDVLVRLFKI